MCVAGAVRRGVCAFACLVFVASGCDSGAARSHQQAEVIPTGARQLIAPTLAARDDADGGSVNEANKCSLMAPAMTLELERAYSCWVWAAGDHPRVGHDFGLGRTRAGQPVLSDFRGHFTRLPALRVEPHFDKVTRSCVVLAYGRSVTVEYSIAHHGLVQHC
jgi:hypothetical protein